MLSSLQDNWVSSDGDIPSNSTKIDFSTSKGIESGGGVCNAAENCSCSLGPDVVPEEAKESFPVDPVVLPERIEAPVLIPEVDSGFSVEIAIPDSVDEDDGENFRKEVRSGVSILNITKFQVDGGIMEERSFHSYLFWRRWIQSMLTSCVKRWAVLKTFLKKLKLLMKLLCISHLTQCHELCKKKWTK